MLSPLIPERELKGGHRQRQRETNIVVRETPIGCLLHVPDQNLGSSPKLGHVLLPGIKPSALQSEGGHSNH